MVPSSSHQDAQQERTTKALADALREVFGENIESGRFMDMQKVPLLCQSVLTIHANVAELKEMVKDLPNQFVSHDSFTPVRAIAFGLVGLLPGIIITLFFLIIQ